MQLFHPDCFTLCHFNPILILFIIGRINIEKRDTYGLRKKSLGFNAQSVSGIEFYVE